MVENIFTTNQTAVGRRKEATARVSLISGTGLLQINNRPGKEYLQDNTVYLYNVFGPLKTLGLANKYDIICSTTGGGLTGQSDSIKLGIARILASMSLENRSILKAKGFLSRNPKVKERKKYGLRKARKAGQFSKR